MYQGLVDIELKLKHVKNGNGVVWTLLFNFDFHFLGTSLRQINTESSVENAAQTGPVPLTSQATTAQLQLRIASTDSMS